MDIQEFDDEYDSDDSFLDRLETIEFVTFHCSNPEEWYLSVMSPGEKQQKPIASHFAHSSLEDTLSAIPHVTSYGQVFTVQQTSSVSCNVPKETSIGIRCIERSLASGPVFHNTGSIKFAVDKEVIKQEVQSWFSERTPPCSSSTRNFYVFDQPRDPNQSMLPFAPQRPRTSGPSSPVTLEEHIGAMKMILWHVGEAFETGISLHNLYGKTLLGNIMKVTFYNTNVQCKLTGSLVYGVPGPWCVKFLFSNSKESSIAGNPDIVLIREGRIRGVLEIKNSEDSVDHGDGQLVLSLLATVFHEREREPVIGAVVHPLRLRIYEMDTSGNVRMIFREGPPKALKPVDTIHGVKASQFIKFLAVIHHFTVHGTV